MIDAGIVLRDHLVLCGADRLQVLNPTARRLWEVSREGADVDRAVAWLVETYGLSREQAARDAAALFDARQRDDAHAVADAGFGRRANRSTAESSSLETHPRPPEGAEHAQFYLADDRPFVICCATTELRRALEPLFAHLRAESREPSQSAGPRFTVASDDGRFRAWRDDVLLFAARTMDECVIGVLSEILVYAYADRDTMACLHAGAVSDGETCLVLAEAGGRGKSTLTAGLLAQGYRYLSDDVVPLEQGTGRAIPVPLCLNLKPGSIPVLSGLYPELPHLPAWRDGDRQLRFLPPPEFARRRPVSSYPVAALAFPCYSPGASLAVEPLDPVDVLQRLIASDMLLELPLDVAKVTALCAWIERTPACAITFSDMGQAIEALIGRWAAHRSVAAAMAP